MEMDLAAKSSGLVALRSLRSLRLNGFLIELVTRKCTQQDNRLGNNSAAFLRDCARKKRRADMRSHSENHKDTEAQSTIPRRAASLCLRVSVVQFSLRSLGQACWSLRPDGQAKFARFGAWGFR